MTPGSQQHPQTFEGTSREPSREWGVVGCSARQAEPKVGASLPQKVPDRGRVVNLPVGECPYSSIPKPVDHGPTQNVRKTYVNKHQLPEAGFPMRRTPGDPSGHLAPR
jgi:hypothetical protein